MNVGKNKTISLIHSSLLISMVMLIAKILSFFRDVLLAKYFGASAISDAVLTSTYLLMLLTTFLRSSFASAYLPIATDKYINNDNKECFFGSIYSSAVFVGVIIMLLVVALIDVLIDIFLPGFTGEAFATLKIMVLIQVPIIPFLFLEVVNDGNLRLLNRFGVSEISAAIITAIYLLYLLLYKERASPEGISWCVVLAYIVSFCFSYFIVRRSDIIIKWNCNLRVIQQEIKPIALAMLPFMIAESAREINIFLDRAITSLLDYGSITMQTYASKITVTEIGMAATAISLVVFSQVAKLNALGDYKEMKKVVSDSILFINTLMVPCCVGTIIFSNEIISMLFGHGQFTSSNVYTTANTMSIYAVGMLGVGMESVLLNVMFATKHRYYPTIINVISIALNLILNLLLYRPLGLYGIALSSTIISLFKIPFYLYYVNNNIVFLEKRQYMVMSFMKLFFMSIIGGFFGCFFLNVGLIFFATNTIVLLISFLSYFFIILIGMAHWGNKYAYNGLQYIKRII